MLCSSSDSVLPAVSKYCLIPALTRIHTYLLCCSVKRAIFGAATVRLVPLSFGATTAYLNKSSYSSLSPAETELPLLSECASGDGQLEAELSPSADIVQISKLSHKLRMRITTAEAGLVAGALYLECRRCPGNANGLKHLSGWSSGVPT